MAKGSFPYERRVAERLKRRANRQTQSLQEQRRNLASAKEEGVELTDEQFEAVSLGDCIMDFACPKCGGKIDCNSCDDCCNCTCPRCGYRFKKRAQTFY